MCGGIELHLSLVACAESLGRARCWRGWYEAQNDREQDKLRFRTESNISHACLGFVARVLKLLQRKFEFMCLTTVLNTMIRL